MEESLTSTVSTILNRECTIEIEYADTGADSLTIIEIDLHVPKQTDRIWTECHCDEGVLSLPKENLCMHITRSLLTMHMMYCMAGIYGKEAVEAQFIK